MRKGSSVKQLDDKVAIVTGGSRGIGRAIAERFAAEGAKVVLAARNGAELEDAAAAISKAGGSVLAIKADVTVESDVQALFAAAMKAHGRVDILINNAGTSKAAPTDQLTLDDWKRVLDTNVTGAFLCAREALKIMKPQKGGRIISIGSVAVLAPKQNSATYTTTKYALEGLTRTLALDGRAHGIAASIITLGGTRTAFNQHRAADNAKLEYLMDPADVARVVLLMASLPPEVNLFDATMLPVSAPSFLGRG